MDKSLDLKLDKIRNGNYQNTDFIIADAKDGDMGGGVFAPGPMLDNPEKPKPYNRYLQAMREMTDSGLVDIMLMSASSAEILTDENKIILLNDFNNEKAFKISFGKKKHYLLKII